MKFLFAPLESNRNEINKNVKSYKFLNLISNMTKLKNRVNLKTVEDELMNYTVIGSDAIRFRQNMELGLPVYTIGRVHPTQIKNFIRACGRE